MTRDLRDYRADMLVTDVPVMDAEGIRVSRYIPSDREISFARMRAAISEGGRGILAEGVPMTRLHVDGALWMSDTPDEMRDHLFPWMEARERGGRILVHGLGLGMIVQAFLRMPQVEHVDVVESDERIIRLIGTHYAEKYPGRITFHHGDAYTYRFPPGTRWTVAWHDTWQHISADNWPEMNRLHRRYGSRVDWQWSWCRGEVEQLVRREKRMPW